MVRLAQQQPFQESLYGLMVHQLTSHIGGEAIRTIVEEIPRI